MCVWCACVVLPGACALVAGGGNGVSRRAQAHGCMDVEGWVCGGVERVDEEVILSASKPMPHGQITKSHVCDDC